MVFGPAEDKFFFNMKHSFLLAVLIFAGQSLGADVTLNLGTLSGSGLTTSSGVVIGSDAKTSGTTQDSSVVNDATYSTLSGVITSDLVWYSNIGSTSATDIGGISAVGNAATIVTDGPNTAKAVSAAAFAYTLSSSVLATLDTSKSITLSFNVYVSGGNNAEGKRSQYIQFALLTSNGSSTTYTYANTDGTGTAAADVTLTLSSAQVTALAEAKVDQKLIFVASDTEIVTGTNEAFTIKDIKLNYTTVPEPTTATLSLLALVGLCSRRRRRG